MHALAVVEVLGHQPEAVAVFGPRYGLRWAASTDTPRKQVPRIAPIHTSVFAAFLLSGL